MQLFGTESSSLQNRERGLPSDGGRTTQYRNRTLLGRGRKMALPPVVWVNYGQAESRDLS